jgi:hypothetical protein
MKSTNNLDHLQVKPEEYGPEYSKQLMEQYKLYVEMADRVSERRSSANTFFLTANTLLISIFGAIVANAPSSTALKEIWLFIFALSGIAFSVAWFYLVQSYRQLNSGKFKVIHAIEQNLPLALYKAEWKALGEGRDPKIYRPLTKIEIYAPLTFALLYALILALSAYIRFSSLK